MTTDKFQNRYRVASARAAWHDYSGGAYFVTICTAGMECFFGNIDNGAMVLNTLGKYVEECIGKISAHYPYAEIPLFTVMPNHVHLIVFVDGGDKIVSGRCRDAACHVSTDNKTKNAKMQEIANKSIGLGAVIGGIKSAVTRYANAHHIPFGWQTRFHDRIIRHQNEMNRIAEYNRNQSPTMGNG